MPLSSATAGNRLASEKFLHFEELLVFNCLFFFSFVLFCLSSSSYIGIFGFPFPLSSFLVVDRYLISPAAISIWQQPAELLHPLKYSTIQVSEDEGELRLQGRDKKDIHKVRPSFSNNQSKLTL